MDKNTLTGVLLMGAIIFGFMWLNKPTAEEIEQARKEQQEQRADSLRRAESAREEALTIPEITAADKAALCNGLALYGREMANGLRGVGSDTYELTLENDSTVSGVIKTANGEIDVNDVINNTADADQLTRANAARALKGAISDLQRYRNFAAHLNGTDTVIGMENDVIALEFSSRGGQISNVILKNYDCYINPDDTTKIQLWKADTNSYSFTLRSDSEKFESSQFYFTPVMENDSTLLMKLDLGAGAWWGIRYTLPEADGYRVKMDVVQHSMQSAGVIPVGVTTMEFNWHQKMARFERGRVYEQRNSALYYKEAGDDVEHLSEQKDAAKTVDVPVKWFGYKNQFFSSMLIADDTFNAGSKVVSEDLSDNITYLKAMTTTAQVNYSTSAEQVAGFNFYLGPNLYAELRDMDRVDPEGHLDLTHVIPLGWSLFRWINTGVIIPVFGFLSKYIVNYGIIILLLAFLIKVVLYPFTYKTYRSQAKMRLLAPEIKAINEKYSAPEDAMKKSQKTMELYTKAGVNPMGGCLPMLLQMPILVAMFSFFPSCIELRGEQFLWAKDLAAPDAIISWTANIPLISWLFDYHLSLFCLLMTATNIVYSKVMMDSQPGGNSMPGMKMMTYAMPLMFLFLFNNYPAGLSYYYFVFLLLTILQTYAIRHWVIDEDKVRAEMAANAKKPKKKSGWLARMEAAQRQQQQLMREQAQGKNKKK